MAKTVVNLSDSMAQFVVKANQISTHVGDTTQLTTIEDSDLVGAINELDSDVGARASLITDDKANLVTAINEIKTQALGIDSNLAVYLRSDVTDTKTAGDLNFVDNVKATFGNGSDLQLYHDGFNSYVKDAGTGDLLVQGTQIKLQDASGNDYLRGFTGGSVYLHHAGNNKFETTSTGVAVTGNATFANNGKAIFGAGSDLQVFHDGSASIVYDNGTGPLNLQTNNSNINIKGGGSASDTMAIFKSTEGVELYYNNVKKFETSSTGATISGDLLVDGADPEIVIQDTDDTGDAYIRFKNNSGTQRSFIQTAMTGNVMLFGTGTTEHMRLDTSGNLLVGNTTFGAADGVYISQGGNYVWARSDDTSGYFDRTNSDGRVLEFRKDGTTVGSIAVSASSTTYNTTSDIRLKTDIEPLQATDKLMAMNPVSYHWKVDPQGPKSIGFIAQEMQDIMPEAVSGDDEGMMGMDYGRITPVLVAALQDAHRKIEQLEKRIADMENA
jgi:hypothetical protein